MKLWPERKGKGSEVVKRLDCNAALREIEILRSDGYSEAEKSDAWQRLIGMLEHA